MEPEETFDILIIGAGLSGINTAHYIQTRGPPNHSSYAILEARGSIGGTWSLFKYPGVRSDSDIFTFGFSWNPWEGKLPVASGPSICNYLAESAAKEGIDKHIRFHQKVISADWSSKTSTWVLKVRKGGDDENDEGEIITYRTRFLVLGTGYYDYNQALETDIPGIKNFKGPVVQPQFWPDDLDYTNQKVVVIGSGATAITLVPSMAEDAHKVTMLQRSPSYIFSLPARRPSIFTNMLRAVLPRTWCGRLIRLRYILLASFLWNFCQWFPKLSRTIMRKAAKAQLPPGYPLDPHFNPSYFPWDQRLCLSPNGDFYSAIRSTKADIATDTIKTVTENSIKLASGQSLEADIIVAATGLKVQFAGGIKLSLDGEPFSPGSKYSLKGCMVQDAPNLGFVLGYAQASWTLGAEATGVFFSRLWSTMAQKGIKVVKPTGAESNTKALPFFPLSSTYIEKGKGDMPMSGEGIWSSRTEYFKDIRTATWSNVLESMETQ